MIRELKTLVAVAQHGTFAAAGQQTGLTQAAVSAQMKRLEAELGVTLFERSGRNAVLTSQGQATLQQARALLALYRTLGAAGTDQAPGTLITLGAIASYQRTLLPDVLAHFHRHFPHCRSRVVPGLSLGLMSQVDAGELDMAVIIRPPFSLHSDLRWQPLAHEPFRLLVPQGWSGSDWRALLERHPFVRYDRTSFGGGRSSASCAISTARCAMCVKSMSWMPSFGWWPTAWAWRWCQSLVPSTTGPAASGQSASMSTPFTGTSEWCIAAIAQATRPPAP